MKLTCHFNNTVEMVAENNPFLADLDPKVLQKCKALLKLDDRLYVLK